jgi:hypothetical protein
MSMTRWSSVAVLASVLAGLAAAGGCARGLIAGEGVFADGEGGGGDGGSDGDGGDARGGDGGDPSGPKKTTSHVSSTGTSSVAVGTGVTATSTGAGVGCNAATQLTCTDGTCVPLAARCNGVTDCFGASDEAGCGANVASSSGSGNNCPGEFACNDGTCISASWECDFEDDCPGGEDELDCGSGGQWICPQEYYGGLDGCDCGCGTLDPDCFGPESFWCDFCDEGCAFDCSDINSNQNWTCF